MLSIAQQANEADSRNAYRAREFDAERQDRAAQFNASQTFSNRDQGLAESELAQIQQRSFGQQELHQQQFAFEARNEFTAADNLRLQQAEAGRASFAAQQHTFEPNQYAAGLAQYDAQIGALNQKKQFTDEKLRHAKLQNDVLQAQHAAAVRSAERATDVTALPARTFKKLNPATGQEEEFTLNSKGDPIAFPFSKPETAAPKVVPFNTGLAIKEAELEANAAHPPQTDELTGKQTFSGDNAQYRFKVFQRLKAEHERAANPTAPPAPQQPQQAPIVGPATAAAQQESLKPFDAEKPESWHPQQRLQQEQFVAQRNDLLNRTDIPGPVKLEAVDKLQRANELLQKEGSFQGMNDKQKAEFVKIMEFIRSVAPPPAPAAQQQPPAIPRPGLNFGTNRPGARVGGFR